jgi:hypothetical protein
MMIVRVTNEKGLLSEKSEYVPLGNYLVLQSPMYDEVILYNSKGDHFHVLIIEFMIAFDHGNLLNLCHSVLA